MNRNCVVLIGYEAFGFFMSSLESSAKPSAFVSKSTAQSERKAGRQRAAVLIPN